MRRTLPLVVALLLTGCGGAEQEPFVPAQAAEPQHAELGWRESHPAGVGARLVFEVDTLDVTADGWSVGVAVVNRTGIDFEIDTGPTDYGLGLMLFANDDLKALVDADREGQLPAIRRATRIEPRPPRILRPGATWRATLSAPGSLADGSWVRVVFGTFLGQDEPPDEFARVVWFTDRAHRL